MIHLTHLHTPQTGLTMHTAGQPTAVDANMDIDSSGQTADDVHRLRRRGIYGVGFDKNHVMCFGIYFAYIFRT